MRNPAKNSALLLNSYVMYGPYEGFLPPKTLFPLSVNNEQTVHFLGLAFAISSSFTWPDSRNGTVMQKTTRAAGQ